MTMKTGKYRGFHIIKKQDKQGRNIHTFFRKYIPVVRFDSGSVDERKPVLDMITRRAGYIKMFGETLIVVLDWIENKKHRQAAVRFCRRLNQTEIKLI